MFARKDNGFTLIELLVVIALIGILSTLVIANLNSVRERSRDVARKTDIRNIQTALRIYYNDLGVYPNNNTSYQIMGCGDLGTSLCEWGSEWSRGTNVYMATLPKDPLTGQTYRYTQVDNDNYTLETCLENKSDDKGVVTTNTTWCSTGWEYLAKP